MNLNILNTKVQNFIQNNLKTDLTKLILKGSSIKNVTIQEIAEQIESKNKCYKKLPTWYKTLNIYYPNKLNIEQTSSEETASYKASLLKGESIIDITGGFGVDAYYFSKVSKSVIHCEINENLSNIVKHNLVNLKGPNITAINTDGLDFLKHTENKFDVIFCDPSRRNELKGKVFLLEDCLPNVPDNLDLFFEKSCKVLLKLSPILDIRSAIGSLNFIKEIHSVAVENEVKEILFLLVKNYEGPISFKTINIQKKGNESFDFTLNEESKASYSLPHKFLYEPNAAIMKSGAFQQISEQLKIDKLHPNSHLYTSNEKIHFPGRIFQINHCISYNKKLLKKLIPTKKANITTRNFPETVAQIRTKTKLKDGGNQFVFFTTDINNNHIVLVCEKLN